MIKTIVMSSPSKINGLNLLGYGTPHKIKFKNGVQVEPALNEIEEESVLSKKDLETLQKNLNLTLQQQNEGLKDELKAIQESILPLKDLTSTITTFINETKENISNLWKHCLEDRDTLEHIESKIKALEGKHKSFNESLKKVTSNSS